VLLVWRDQGLVNVFEGLPQIVRLRGPREAH
jgi:hypothetical protein